MAPKNVGTLGPPSSWDGDVADLSVLYCTKFGHSRLNHSSIIMENYLPEILTRHAPPFKVTQGHWNRHGSIGYYDFVMVFPSYRSRISYHFQYKGQYL